ncbi:MAG: hypothetical protein HYV03_01275 [Deltaproteobacteria bacterium]|nr:hypothetical protein [Deltaproteobacteria bacterium]
MHKRSAILMVYCLLVCRAAMAQETAVMEEAVKPKRPINMTTVRVLSYLPFNSPALFYARKPVSGVVTTVFEGLGLTLGILGTVGYIGRKTSDCDVLFEPLCQGAEALGNTLLITAMAGGYVMWLPSWIYAMTKAPNAAEEHNDFISRTHFRAVPTAWLSNSSGNVGLVGQF